MKRFLSNSFCNFFLISFIFSKIVLFYSETHSKSKVLNCITELHDSLLKISDKTITSEKLELIDDMVQNSYDLEKMGKMIIGVDWKKNDKINQTEFINAFKRFISVNYFKRFNKIDKLDFEYHTVEVIGDKFRLARVILIADNEKVNIDYLLNFKNEKWKIFDVLLDGSVSEISTKKSDFKKILNEEGIQGLIKNLRIRNQL